MGELHIVRQVGGLAQAWVERVRPTASRGRCEFQKIWTVRNQLVAKRILDLTVLQEKSARHALDITRRQQGKIALHPGHQHAMDALAVQVLAQLGARKPECFIEPSVGVSESRKIVQFVRAEEFGGALFGAEMHKCDARALGLNLGTETGELGDRLAAERSTKVSQEHE